MKNMLKKLFSEKELSDNNSERLGKTLTYIKHYLIDSDSNMYLVLDLLIDINNINNWFEQILLQEKVNFEPYVCDKMYMGKIWQKINCIN